MACKFGRKRSILIRWQDRCKLSWNVSGNKWVLISSRCNKTFQLDLNNAAFTLWLFDILPLFSIGLCNNWESILIQTFKHQILISCIIVPCLIFLWIPLIFFYSLNLQNISQLIIIKNLTILLWIIINFTCILRFIKGIHLWGIFVLDDSMLWTEAFSTSNALARVMTFCGFDKFIDIHRYNLVII